MVDFPTTDILIGRAKSMRRNPTYAEKVFYARLVSAKIRFKSQWVIKPYIVDFLIGNTIIELDGSAHNGREEYDAKRDCFLRKAKYQIIRIQNSDVEKFDLARLYKCSNKKAKKNKNVKSKPKSCSEKYYQKSPLRKVVFNNMKGLYKTEQEFQSAYKAAKLECKKRGIKM